MKLTEKAALFISKHRLFNHGDRLIVAVSGGADSVALLDILHTVTDPACLVVAHVNHLLRDEASDRDEQFVRALAAQYSLPCEVARINVRQLAATENKSIEEAGREARYAYFEQLRLKHRAEAVAVAHHLDDQAETLLLRLIRGAGSTGLSAISPKNSSNVVRPLLEITKQELLDHLKAQRLEFCEDASNQDLSFLRNRIRHELLPLLESYGSGISRRLANTAELLGEENRLLRDLAAARFNEISTKGNSWVALNRPPLSDHPLAMRNLLYRMAVKNVKGDLRRFERKHFALIDDYLAAGQTGGQLDLPDGLTASLTSGHLLFADADGLGLEPLSETVINGPGCYSLANSLELTVEESFAPATSLLTGPDILWLGAEAAPFPWTVRAKAPSDRFQPTGMTGHKSLKDLFVDIKLPAFLRQSLPLLIISGQIIWLAGLRRSELVQSPSPGSPALKISITGLTKLPLFPDQI